MNLVMQYILQELKKCHLVEKLNWYLRQCVLKTIEIFNLHTIGFLIAKLKCNNITFFVNFL